MMSGNFTVIPEGQSGANTAAGVLAEAVWKDTSEGYDYWAQVHARIQQIARDGKLKVDTDPKKKTAKKKAVKRR